MKHEKDLELQELFQGCGYPLVNEFCKINNIHFDLYQDHTGIRFFFGYDEKYLGCDRIYCTPDNGFTYYITYSFFKKELINSFKRFKNLRCFL